MCNAVRPDGGSPRLRHGDRLWTAWTSRSSRRSPFPATTLRALRGVPLLAVYGRVVDGLHGIRARREGWQFPVDLLWEGLTDCPSTLNRKTSHGVAPSYAEPQRRPDGDGLSPPGDQQRLTAHEVRSLNAFAITTRTACRQRNPLMETATFHRHFDRPRPTAPASLSSVVGTPGIGCPPTGDSFR